MNPKGKIVMFIVIVLLIIAGVVLWYLSPSFKKSVNIFDKPKVVEETLVIPDTKVVEVAAGRTPATDKYQVPLVPVKESDKAIVANAVLTLKESFYIAFPNALKWSKDANLIFITSGGAVTLEGKSSQWQVVFGSLLKKKGYEVIIQADKIVSEKEIPSTEYGYNLPKNWYDANEAIKSIQTLPQFAKATVSSINFFYSEDAKQWRYGLATSVGNSSIPIR